MSQMVHSTLKWLSRPEILQSSRCTLVVGPDPRRFPPIPPRAGAGFRQYRLRFSAGEEDTQFAEATPTAAESFYAFCVNASPISRRSNVLSSPISSQWIDLVEQNELNADDQPLREVLLNLLDAFPRYDLKSTEGVQAAIRDMRRRIASVYPASGQAQRDGVLPSLESWSESPRIVSSIDRSSTRDALSVLI